MDTAQITQTFRKLLDEHEESDVRRFDELRMALSDFSSRRDEMHKENSDKLSRVLLVLEGDRMDPDNPGMIIRFRDNEQAVKGMQDAATKRAATAKKLSIMALIGVVGLVGKSAYDWALLRLTGGH